MNTIAVQEWRIWTEKDLSQGLYQDGITVLFPPAANAADVARILTDRFEKDAAALRESCPTSSAGNEVETLLKLEKGLPRDLYLPKVLIDTMDWQTKTGDLVKDGWTE